MYLHNKKLINTLNYKFKTIDFVLKKLNLNIQNVLEKEEINLNKELERGYIVRPVSDFKELENIQKIFIKQISKDYKLEKIIY